MIKVFAKCTTLLIFFLISACSSTNGPVAVLVEIPRSIDLKNNVIDAQFTAVIPKLENISGLKRKYFARNENTFGGIYYWESKAEAESFFNDEWKTRVRSIYGVDAKFTYFKIPAVTAGGSEGLANTNSIVTIVSVSAPWYAPQRIIVSKMKKSTSLYTSVQGLDFKYFTIAEGNKVGGIYLWDNTASADTFYNEAWHTRIRETYGTDANMTRFHTPFQFTK